MVKAISQMFPVFSKVDCKHETPGVILQEKALAGFVNLRVNPTSTTLASAVATTLGHSLPAINQVVNEDNHLIVGLGPSEWLIVCENGADMTHGLSTGLADAYALVADVSGGYTQLLITGNNAADMLEKGTTVDLHASVFKVGDAYTTLLAKAPVTIIKQKDGMLVICRRSFADHLARWAVDAGEEYGLEIKH